MNSELAHYRKWLWIGILIFVVGVACMFWGGESKNPSPLELSVFLAGTIMLTTGGLMAIVNDINISNLQK